MKATSLFLIALIAVASASNFRSPLSKAQTFEVLAQLDAHPLGNLVMSQLSLHVAAEGLIEDILNMVQGLIDQVNQQQSEADTLHASELTSCANQQAQYSEKRDSNLANYNAAIAKEAATNGLLADAQVNLVTEEDNIVNLNNRLEAGQATRDEQYAAFVIEDTYLGEAVSAVQEAIRLIANLNSGLGGSFIQMKEKFQAVTARLQKNQDKLAGRFEIYTPIVQSLIQVSQNEGTTEVLSNILSLLGNLEGMIQAARNEGQALENQRQDFWDNEKADLTSQRNGAISRRNQLITDIANYKTLIVECQETAKFSDEQYVHYGALYDAKVNYCDNEQIEYSAGTASRTQENEVLSKLLSYMADNADQFQDYLVERIN